MITSRDLYTVILTRVMDGRAMKNIAGTLSLKLVIRITLKK
jgi:hypothetical protein